MQDPSEHERDAQGTAGERRPQRSGHSSTPSLGILTGRRPVVFAATLGVIALVVIAVALGSGLGSPSPSTVVVGRNPLMDQPAPDFTLQTVDGTSVSLAALRGRPVIINFWASWCGPCREEFPLLVDAYSKYAPDGLEILGIIHADGPQSATQFAQSYGASWPLLADPDESVWRLYNGSLLPVSYYIDRDGIVRAVSYGAPPSGFLDDQIARIL